MHVLFSPTNCTYKNTDRNSIDSIVFLSTEPS